MTTHTIYTHPHLPTVAIKKGWCWPAFFFTGIWCLIKGLYVHFFIVLVAFIVGIVLAVMMLPTADVDFIRSTVVTIIGFVMGAYGNEMRSKDIINKGYTVFKSVEAASPEDALKHAPQPSNTNHTNDNSQDKYAQLEKLKELKDAGALTEEEFVEEKQKILS